MPALFVVVTAVAIAVLNATTLGPSTQVAANPGPTLPAQAVGPGTTHGVTLPGVVELKGSAARPQHPLPDPRDAEAPAQPGSDK